MQRLDVVVHGVRAQVQLAVEQGVEAFTRGSAYAEFQEHRKGTLAPGMLADLALVSQDPFTAPIPALPATVSVLTMVGGNDGGRQDRLGSGGAAAGVT